MTTLARRQELAARPRCVRCNRNVGAIKLRTKFTVMLCAKCEPFVTAEGLPGFILEAAASNGTWETDTLGDRVVFATTREALEAAKRLGLRSMSNPGRPWRIRPVDEAPMTDGTGQVTR